MCLDSAVAFCVYVSSLSFFFFFSAATHAFREQTAIVHEQQLYIVDFSASSISPVDPVNSARDPQTSLFSNFFFKNGSHDTIHTFKNYFATVFSVFSFSKISSFQTDPLFILQPTPPNLIFIFNIFNIYIYIYIYSFWFLFLVIQVWVVFILPFYVLKFLFWP